MGEHISRNYQRLFEIRLLHHYWLDEGQTVFDLITKQEKREARLLHYDVRTLLTLRPTATTEQVLKGLGGLYKSTALGCIVALPRTETISSDALFEFVVTIRSREFFDYTAFTLRLQKIHELYHLTENRLYRYKENVPVLSNVTGASRNTAAGKALFLSSEIPSSATEGQVEAFVRLGNALLQLTGDQPDAGTQQLSADANKLPVFVHQGDIPPLASPVGLSGVPKRGIALSADVPDDVFVLIRLAAGGAIDEDFNLIGVGGQIKTPHPVFQVRFKNRSTTWRYVNKTTGALISTESTPLPLTRFGNPGTKQKPSEGAVRPVIVGGKIAQLVSDIFI